VRQGYGLPRDSEDEGPGRGRPPMPLMPVAWTAEIVRLLFPIPLGFGRKVLFTSRSSAPVLVLVHSGSKEFPATMRGWVDLWTTVTPLVKPGNLQMGIERVRYARTTARATPFRNAEAVLGALVFSGGHEYGDILQTGAVVDLRMAADDIVLTGVADGSTAYSVPGRRLIEIEASGPGAVTSGGFVATVGHGFVGDLTDRFVAERMTDRFGKTTITTVIRMATETGELFLRSMIDTPEAAQVALSPLRALVRGRASGATGAVPAPTVEPLNASPASLATAGDGADDLVSRLERLARLRESSALSEDEYLVAKSKLLS
jgi:hypothetical protein